MSTATLETSQIQQTSAPIVQPRAVAAVIDAATEAQQPRKRPISARDYMRMAEIGLFEEQRVELIGGEIIDMPPISEDHAQSVDKITKKLNRTLDEELIVRGQHPFDAGENGRPEPDVAIVRPDLLSPDAPPAEAILIVEISKATLRYDQTTKASLYASLGIADYWIVNLIENQVEVYRQPIESASAQFGHDYASRQIYRRGQSVALLETPEVSIEVGEMLP